MKSFSKRGLENDRSLGRQNYDHLPPYDYNNIGKAYPSLTLVVVIVVVVTIIIILSTSILIILAMIVSNSNKKDDDQNSKNQNLYFLCVTGNSTKYYYSWIVGRIITPLCYTLHTL
jgi:hypothetical protein